jgi:hypothetical protein
MSESRSSRSRRRGQSMLEFTLVGIPLMFVLISIFEISRGMWVYHTLAYAVKEGVRYAIVHGENCTQNGNNCAASIATIAQKIQDAGVGIDTGTGKTLLTFKSGGVGNPPTFATTDTCFLGDTCSANVAQWPAFGPNQVGQAIEIDIVTPFRSALALFWPGGKAFMFGSANLPASATERIQF